MDFHSGEIKLLEEERIKFLKETTPPAETLETPPILDTHGANNQGMRGDSSIQEVHKIVTKFIDEKFPNL